MIVPRASTRTGQCLARAGLAREQQRQAGAVGRVLRSRGRVCPASHVELGERRPEHLLLGLGENEIVPSGAWLRSHLPLWL
jgi:hypothetical protein